MRHETGHAFSNKLGIAVEGIDWKNEFVIKNAYTGQLDSTDEFIMYKLEHVGAKINNFPQKDLIPQFRLDRMFQKLDIYRQSIINDGIKKSTSL